MPGINGMELLKAVRSFSLTRGLPFVMITAQADRYSLAEARHAGASELLVKPFVGDQLAQVIIELNPAMEPGIRRKQASHRARGQIAEQKYQDQALVEAAEDRAALQQLLNNKKKAA